MSPTKERFSALFSQFRLSTLVLACAVINSDRNQGVTVDLLC